MEPPPKSDPRLFLIDAYALIYRSFYAFIRQPLMTSKGENTSAPFGFAQFLERVRTELEPDYLAVVFDAGTSFREETYPEYKATREKMPEELKASLPRIRSLCDAYRFPVVELDGYEADDVIGTLARKAAEEDLEAVIVSGDKDFYQLIGPSVRLLNPGRGGPTGVEAEWVDESNASEKFGIPPERVVDYLALIGDSSDNVPGAPGVGPKTAVKLLETYGTLDEALDHAEEISGKRAREALTDHAEQVRLSRELVTILDDLPVELDLDAFAVNEPDREALHELFVELEFRRLAETWAPEQVGEEKAPAREETRTVVATAEACDELAERIREAGHVVVAVEGSSTDAFRSDLVGLAVALDAGEAFYLPFGHGAPPELALDDAPTGGENLPPLDGSALEALREVLEDDRVRKVGHDLKRASLILRNAGVDLGGLDFDLMLASYVLDPGRRDHSLDALAVDLLGRSRPSYAEVTSRGRERVPFVEVAVEAACAYAGAGVASAAALRERLGEDLEAHGLEDLFRELEMPLVPVLARMERAGIGLDVPFFREMGEKLASELGHIQDEIFAVAGGEFNVNSTPQLREVLFERLELPVIKRTKTGPSTDASVLEELAQQGHDLPRLLLEYRELEKLRSTYVDALPKLVHPETGRIHTSFNQAVAATGRLSSSDPNLQNIPIRTDLGREIRKGFVADEGHMLLGVDYSQIELRILAHFSGDDAFVRAFREGIDVHVQTASVIFDVDIDDVTPAMRAQAKTINFATLYGQGSFSLAKQLGLSRTEAQEFIDQYFERFSGVRSFLDEQVELAREQGYVETLLGRRRHVPELGARNWNVRQFGERVAQNTPIQGTAADLIKKAMIEIDGVLEEDRAPGRMLLQVHDELLFEVPEDGVEVLRDVVVELMEGALELSVPLEAEWGVGRTWYEAKA